MANVHKATYSASIFQKWHFLHFCPGWGEFGQVDNIAPSLLIVGKKNFLCLYIYYELYREGLFEPKIIEHFGDAFNNTKTPLNRKQQLVDKFMPT